MYTTSHTTHSCQYPQDLMHRGAKKIIYKLWGPTDGMGVYMEVCSVGVLGNDTKTQVQQNKSRCVPPMLMVKYSLWFTVTIASTWNWVQYIPMTPYCWGVSDETSPCCVVGTEATLARSLLTEMELWRGTLRWNPGDTLPLTLWISATQTVKIYSFYSKQNSSIPCKTMVNHNTVIHRPHVPITQTIHDISWDTP